MCLLETFSTFLTYFIIAAKFYTVSLLKYISWTGRASLKGLFSDTYSVAPKSVLLALFNFLFSNKDSLSPLVEARAPSRSIVTSWTSLSMKVTTKQWSPHKFCMSCGAKRPRSSLKINFQSYRVESLLETAFSVVGTSFGESWKPQEKLSTALTVWLAFWSAFLGFCGKLKAAAPKHCFACILWALILVDGTIWAGPSKTTATKLIYGVYGKHALTYRSISKRRWYARYTGP